MAALELALRDQLEDAIQAARETAGIAAEAAINGLGVGQDKPDPFASEQDKTLRNRLRTHGKQLGDHRESRSSNPTYGAQDIDLLVQEVAYQHWHRMLFARFLAENDLLMFDGVPVTIDECEELAADEGAKSGWDLAGRLAAQMLPEVFKPDSPVFAVWFAAEHQSRLEKLLRDLPAAVFKASDSLGWVYQFWQADSKERINKSAVKIGAAELPAVTQLFTEDYMVDFLLDNTLGAWHAGKVFAVTPFLATSADTEEELREALALQGCKWRFLRFVRSDDGVWAPAAGTFPKWPRSARDLRCLDPSMGSAHFIVALFERLVPLLIHDEDLTAIEAVLHAVQSNLYGLEIDPRCTQIGAFNLALAAWRRVGYRPLPRMNLACSGIAPNATESDWLALAGESEELRSGMANLYRLFNNAPVLGSLINPHLGSGDMLEATFEELRPILDRALSLEGQDDQRQELAVAASGLAKAASILASQFTLVATNVPYLGRIKQEKSLQDYCERVHEKAKQDLATCFVDRIFALCEEGGTAALVTPQNWWFSSTYKGFRKEVFAERTILFAATLGEEAWQAFGDRGPFAGLLALSADSPRDVVKFSGFDALPRRTIEEKVRELEGGEILALSQSAIQKNADFRLSVSSPTRLQTLEAFARSYQGIKTGDDKRFTRYFWELDRMTDEWCPYQGSVSDTCLAGGLDMVLYWADNGASLARRQGVKAWGRQGVLVCLMRDLPATRYFGHVFSSAVSPLVIADPRNLLPVWAYCSSPEFRVEVRKIDRRVCVTNANILKVPFDLAKWEQVAVERFPNGLPPPTSNDPTQWIFDGNPSTSDDPLQVAVARLLGYKWPRQNGSQFPDCPALPADHLDSQSDQDGIVCVPAVGRESSAADRLMNLLAASYGEKWTSDTLSHLLARADHQGKSLETWIRDKFFAQHCKRFGGRPFIWHIWDGLNDGFSALVNYHRFDYKALEKLTYNLLGQDWIGRQKADAARAVDGAQERLAAAEALKRRLEKILEGEAPHDIFIRWKSLDKQPIGWNPDLSDGVRLNIRPFLTVTDVAKRGAGVLRDRPSVKWEKDAGAGVESDPWYELGLQYDGKAGDRINDHHLTLVEKIAARKAQEKA